MVKMMKRITMRTAHGAMSKKLRVMLLMEGQGTIIAHHIGAERIHMVTAMEEIIAGS